MPNRYHSPFKTLKIKGAAPPATGARGSRASLPKESAKGRPTSKGNAKSDRGHGMKLVKTFVAGEYMKNNPGHGLYGRQMGAPIAEPLPPVPTLPPIPPGPGRHYIGPPVMDVTTPKGRKHPAPVRPAGPPTRKSLL